jgi:transcriptional regulator with XRE-family HTH domain
MTKQETLDNLKELGFNVQKISELTGIPSGRIYKWYKGNGLPKLEDFQKLTELYDNMKPNPTNDHMGGKVNLAAEAEPVYLTPQQQIKLLVEANELKDSKIIQLEIELEDCKSKVVRLGKTGGRRN